jgi:hypothetical protein
MEGSASAPPNSLLQEEDEKQVRLASGATPDDVVVFLNPFRRGRTAETPVSSAVFRPRAPRFNAVCSESKP